MDSGSFGLHIKGMLSCSLLTLGIRQLWAGQSLPDKQGPKILNYHKIVKITYMGQTGKYSQHLPRKGDFSSSSVTKGAVLGEVGSQTFEIISDPDFYDTQTHALPPASLGAWDFNIQAQGY